MYSFPHEGWFFGEIDNVRPVIVCRYVPVCGDVETEVIGGMRDELQVRKLSFSKLDRVTDVCCFRVTGSFVGPKTCAQCRQRKVRCDKRPGSCSNCERLNMQCSPFIGINNSTTPYQNGHPEGVLKRRLRNAGACSACKRKKIKCTGTLPDCKACKDRAIPCTYPAAKRQRRRSESASGSNIIVGCETTGVDESPQDVQGITDPQPLPDLSPSSDEANVATGEAEKAEEIVAGTTEPTQHSLNNLVEVFFETVYPMPSYAFLHPQTTKRRCQSKDKHKALSLALCSAASLYIQAGKNRKAAATSSAETAAWIQTAEQNIWLHLEQPSISHLQALLLVIHYYMDTGRFSRAFMLIATAARFAAVLRLNHERHHLNPIAREVGRRILWSLKIVERYFSHGLAEFDLLPFEAIYIDFPQKEETFSGLTSYPEEAGAYQLLVRLEVVRRDIIKLTRNITLLEKPWSNLPELINYHRQAIANIGASPSLMNPDAVMDPDAIARDSWLPRRILAYISWQQAQCDLYRILLPGYSEAAPCTVLKGYDPLELIAAEEKCMRHATNIIHIFTALNQYSDRHHLLEFDTAICAYHATRLLLFISCFGKGPNRLSPEFALSRGQLCLAALKRFFFSSALVAPIIKELEQSMHVFLEQQLQTQTNHNNTPLPSGASRPETQAHALTTESELLSTNTYTTSDPLTHESQNSSDQTTFNSAQSKHLSSAAQARQRLAIHSLLRRADFQGDDSEDHVADAQTPEPLHSDTYITNSNYASVQSRNIRSQPLVPPPHDEQNNCHQPSPLLPAQPRANRDGVYSPNTHLQFPRNSALSTSKHRDDRHEVIHLQDSIPSHHHPPPSTVIPSSSSPDPLLSPCEKGPTPLSKLHLESGAMQADSVTGIGSADTMERDMFSWWGQQDWGWLFERAGA
ncbi:hypothetical protein DM02DRAFT_729930 [Periconia macrospinosa]|uniref:Zn(2)-C6 fungal-type domain-containing protein n=1 Tax=Periconia macrospinosa TaxID=97972 RepID=A0A2V1DJL3_9PLEO|nr:hypothetical protein DM02DRAFT_729930 [Periconia macrospinosa]